MRYNTHLMGGVATVAALYAIAPEATVEVGLAMTAGTLIGSLFPDIDHKGSFIGKRLKLLSFLVRMTTGHRGATHAPILLVALSIALLFVGNLFGFGQMWLFGIIGFFCGAISHVLLDALTPAGVPLMYPFSKESTNFAKIKTGSFGETLFGFALMLCIVVALGSYWLPI